MIWLYLPINILLQLKSEPSVDGDTELADPTGGVKEEPSEEMKFEAAAEVKTEQNSSGNVPISTTTPIKKEPGMNIKTEPKELREKLDELQRQRAKDNEVLKDLRAQLKKAQTDVKEMKVLLDMFKTLPKEHRDKAQLMAAEKKVKMELDESRIGNTFGNITIYKHVRNNLCGIFQ